MLTSKADSIAVVRPCARWIALLAFALAACGVRALAGGDAGRVSDLKSDEVVVFFPTVGHRVAGGDDWLCRVHGWVFEPRSKELSLEWIWSAFGLLEEPADDEKKQAWRSARAGLFLVDNERYKHIVIRLGERTFELDPSEANGHCTGSLRLTAAEVVGLRAGHEHENRPLRFRAILPEGDAREFTGEIHLLTPRGLSVISDIDDTIKVTEIRDRKATVRNTFLKEFQPVPGMAEMFQTWARHPDTAFHYLSCSPWQLYGPLDEFRRAAGFPPGSFHLKAFRLKDDSLFDFFDAPEAHKRAVIESLLESNPARRFVLVGDSGQDDPEIYAAIARRHPEQIVRIFIRNTTDQPREHERYRRAFRDLPVATWGVFLGAAEVPVLIP